MDFFFFFIQTVIELSVSKQWRTWSGLGLHCLPMSHKKGACRIWAIMTMSKYFLNKPGTGKSKRGISIVSLMRRLPN